MEFQIFNKNNEVVLLNDFDKIYCRFNGQEVNPEAYGRWYHLLEPVLHIYADIADRAKGSYLHEGVVFKSPSRKVTMRQVAQCLIIWLGSDIGLNDKIEDLDKRYKYIREFVNFALSHKGEYYFEFSF